MTGAEEFTAASTRPKWICSTQEAGNLVSHTGRASVREAEVPHDTETLLGSLSRGRWRASAGWGAQGLWRGCWDLRAPGTSDPKGADCELGLGEAGLGRHGPKGQKGTMGVCKRPCYTETLKRSWLLACAWPPPLPHPLAPGCPPPAPSMLPIHSSWNLQVAPRKCSRALRSHPSPPLRSLAPTGLRGEQGGLLGSSGVPTAALAAQPPA